MPSKRICLILCIAVVLLYAAGQALIGTYDPEEGRFFFAMPADVDFLYYGAIVNQVLNQFPPENPSFAGVKLTQPYLQYIPPALTAPVLNPYNSIRFWNLVWIVLFALLLRRLFPDRYGPALLVMAAGSMLFVDINALGVDLIARGFTHLPFFILLTYALYGAHLGRRAGAIALAALTNGYLALIVLPALAILWLVERRREWLWLGVSTTAGLALAALVVSSEAVDKPVYFLFAESFRLAPAEQLVHAAPFAVLMLTMRSRVPLVLLAVAVVFGALIHYNPFFPVFMIYYAGGLLIADGEMFHRRAPQAMTAVCAVLVVGFVLFAWDKYDPARGDYVPRHDRRLDNARRWIAQNTDPTSAFLTLMPDATDLSLMMEDRPVYLGYTGHVAHLGLPWTERAHRTIQTYAGGDPPDEVDYVFYGPVERTYIPDPQISLPVAYHDQAATIFRAR